MAEYIEREAAKKEFNLNFGSVSHAVIANRILDSIPAADVAPVVHSTWVWVPRTSQYGKQSGEWRCKQCHAIAHGGLSPYCPNCGAKMKLKEDSCDPT